MREKKDPPDHFSITNFYYYYFMVCFVLLKAHGYLKEIETTFIMISRLTILNCMEHISYAVTN